MDHDTLCCDDSERHGFLSRRIVDAKYICCESLVDKMLCMVDLGSFVLHFYLHARSALREVDVWRSSLGV